MYEMSRLHFYIEKRKPKKVTDSNAESPVIVSFSYSSIRVKVYTGRKVRQQEWDKSNERAFPGFLSAVELNPYLDLLEERISRHYSILLSDGVIPEAADFQNQIRFMVKSSVPSFFGLMLRFMEESNSKWSQSTFKKMKTFYSQLQKFSKEKNELLNPGKIDQNFADKLINYYREKGLMDSSIKKNLDLLKWFLNWCMNRKLIYSRDYEHIRFFPKKNNISFNEVFLEWQELISFFNAEGLSKKEMWSRDIFCFICFSGIRFSKISSITKAQINKSHVLYDEHTERKVLLNRFSSEICKRYQNRFYRNDALFPAMSLISFNKYLRSAAEKSGLNRMTFLKESFSEIRPLYQQISARIAMNTHYSVAVKLDNSGVLFKQVNKDTVKSRIFMLSGAEQMAEEKQLNTSDMLYESIRNSGMRP